MYQNNYQVIIFKIREEIRHTYIEKLIYLGKIVYKNVMETEVLRGKPSQLQRLMKKEINKFNKYIDTINTIDTILENQTTGKSWNTRNVNNIYLSNVSQSISEGVTNGNGKIAINVSQSC